MSAGVKNKRLPFWLILLVVTALYVLLGVLGLQWATVNGAGSPVWPAAGVGVAALLMGGVRLWPAIFIGRVATGLLGGSQQPLWAELLLSGGNVLGGVSAVLLVQRFIPIDLRLVRMKDVLGLAAVGALSAAISGVVAMLTLKAANGIDWSAALSVGTNWWFGQWVGTLTIAPLILAWFDRQAPIRGGRQWGHLGAMILATAGLSYVVFMTGPETTLWAWHIFPVLTWAALAFQVRGSALALTTVSAAALWGATDGIGPFANVTPHAADRVFYAQQFAAITSLTILMLAAVADERRGKEALERLNADLERRVQEGAARLAQLHKTESLGQLTGGIAHDFNNLLMAVQGSLELIKKRLPKDDERLARLIENALEGARRGATLTQRLLAFARKQELRPEPVRVPELVMGMADLLRRSLGTQVRIETRLDLNLPRALVDANQLELAILNLSLNARDAMPDGGTLTIAAEVVTVPPGNHLAPGRYISLQASDTGHGMDAATLQRATEPFFTTKGVGKGTGLGLAMVQGLAAQSGGRFTMRSTPGVGTIAEMLLPVADTALAEAADAAEIADAAEHATPVPTPSHAGRLTVLVVDDDPLVLAGTVAMVEDAGHAVLAANSGAEALAILRGKSPVDVVVTDHAMPGMTGAQLATHVRAEFDGLPVILASGYAELPVEVDDLIVARLNKPFRQDDLEHALHRIEKRNPNVVTLRTPRT